jgi:L-fuconolactonase
MPDFPIVDSHVHLWDPSHFKIGWLDSAPKLNKNFGLKEYDEATAGIEVAGMVYLEVDLAPEYKLLEAEWAADRAQEDDRLKVVVASAPIEFGDQVRAFLEALVTISPRVRGVRRLLQGEADPAYCLRPGFLRGVELLAEFGLSFDICVYHPQLKHAVEMVRRTPGTSFILDHIGKPSIRTGLMDPWRAEIEELASLPNVVCKISGATTEANLESWTVEDVAPYVEHCLKAFGEDRVVYGGDWPVVLNASSYKRWVETLDTITASLSPTAKRKLWADNARRFYRIGESDAAD